VKAIARVIGEAPGIELQIFGEGSAKPELVALVSELGLSGHVTLHEPVPLRQVAQIMARADVGIVPKRDDSFGGEAFSTKILEFMAVGTPVIVAATRVDRHYFDGSLVRFFKPGDPDDLAAAFLDLYRNPEKGARLAARALEHARANDWSRKKLDYLALVGRLVTPAAGKASIES
jgi:glycosyltransferase involved in cell wall biosynthesis